MPRPACLLLLCVLVLPAAPARAAGDCPAGAQGGRITVPLDHSGVTPRTLPLSYARVPATAPRTGTLVILSGGPGEAAIPLMPLVAPVLKGLPGYDVVYVDQRGIGGSGGVDATSSTPATSSPPAHGRSARRRRS